MSEPLKDVKIPEGHKRRSTPMCAHVKGSCGKQRCCGGLVCDDGKCGLNPLEIITPSELDEVRDREICRGDQFKGRWRVDEQGQPVWVPYKCKFVLSSWNCDRSSSLFAQCLLKCGEWARKV
jgi:hypothetical protein